MLLPGLSFSVLGVDLDPVLKGQWPGYVRADSSAVAVSGQFAYAVGPYGGLHVLDLSSPANPQWVGACYEAGGTYVAVSGKYACTAHSHYDSAPSERRLRVVDISDPGHPRVVGLLPGISGPVAMSGTYAYVAQSREAYVVLAVIDLSDAANPRQVGEVRGAQHTGPNWNWPPNSIALSGSYVYVANGGDAVLQIYDVSNPAQPQWVGSYQPKAGARGVAVSGNYAYLAEQWADPPTGYVYGGLEVIDIRQPTSPQQVAMYELENIWEEAFAVAVSGDFAYLTRDYLDALTQNWRPRLDVLDISNPAQPRRVGSVDIAGRRGLAAGGDYLYVPGTGLSPLPSLVASTASGLQAINVRDPSHPQVVGQWDTSGGTEGVAVQGTYAYLADGLDGLRILDIRDPAHPLSVGRCDTLGYAKAVAVAGNYAYVGDVQCESDGPMEGVVIVDISDPAQPRRLSTSGIFGDDDCAIVIAGNYAYVTAGGEGVMDFRVIDVRDPQNPQRVGRYGPVGKALGVAVSSTHAYVTGSWYKGGNYHVGALQILDVVDPTRLTPVGSLDFSFAGENEEARGVSLAGQYAYVGTRANGLGVIDVSDPRYPQPVARYPALSPHLAFGAVSPTLAGDHACAWEGGCLRIVDVRNPASPRRIGGHVLERSWDAASGGEFLGRGVTISGNYAYLATGKGGLQVLDLSCPSTLQRIGAADALNTPVNRVAVSGRYVCVLEIAWYSALATLYIFDAADPAHPQLLGQCVPWEREGGLAVSGTLAYVGTGHGFEVIDFSDPSSPRSVAAWEGNGELVAVAGNSALVIERLNANQWALYVIDVSDPRQPRRVGELYIGGQLYIDGVEPAFDIAVSETYAYLATRLPSLQVIDLRDPAHPQLVGEFRTTGRTLGVAAAGTNAYVLDDSGSFLVLDVSIPSQPRLVGSLDLWGGGTYGGGRYRGFGDNRMSVLGHFVYVATGVGGMEVIDVSNPTQPRRVAGNTGFEAWSVVTQGDQLYVAAGIDGFAILNAYQPPLRLNAPLLSGTTVNLSWNGGPGIKLQKTTSLTNPSWQDVVGSDGVSSIQLPRTDPTAFFRLIKQ